MNIDSKTSPRHWRIEDILLYLNNNVKKNTAEKIIHSILISSDILTWNPQGEIVYHGRDIPGTNIEKLLQYAYNSHIPEPRGFDLFTKGLVEAGINKHLIKNEYLLSKMAKEDRKSDKSDNEGEYDDDVTDDDGEPKKLSCNHCGKETGHIVYLMKCPRCSWKDFHWGKTLNV
jgi:hypothetical protein